MAEIVYGRLGGGPVGLAHIVRELGHRWGIENGVGSVHGFVREVATCLLHHDDVEVGDLAAGGFVAWHLPAWDADATIDSELMAMDALLDDETKYVFRKRNVG